MNNGYTDYTLSEVIDSIRRKNAEEQEALADDAIVKQIRARCRLRAFREELYESEMERRACYQVLSPFMPELPAPAPEPPVALQSAPAQPYVDPFEEPFRSPRFMATDGVPPAEVGRYGE